MRDSLGTLFQYLRQSQMREGVISFALFLCFSDDKKEEGRGALALICLLDF